jgi:hypothetical protein
VQRVTRRELLGLGVLTGLCGTTRLAEAADAVPAPVVGTWTYRSFINNPDPNVSFDKLQFAVAQLTIDAADFGTLSGRLAFGADFLKLTGTITYGNPFTLRFQGVGATSGTIENGHPWIYDYLGFLAPAWPNGVDQRPAIVGTIVRTVPHSNGQAKAGYVASWIAVRADK